MAGFADAALPPLLMLAVLESERKTEVQPDLHRLALTLRELQAAVRDRLAAPAICGMAVRRLYATISTPIPAED